jgi:hypothetical protein
MTMDEKRAEWLRLMTDLADNDREAYREARAEAWAAVVRTHQQKTPEQIATWKSKAS